MRHFLTLALGLWAGLTLMIPSDAHAYLDPGTMGMAIQVIVAAIAGGFMFFRSGFTRVRDLALRIVGRKPAKSPVEPPKP
ncbi:MAG: hypothetical protein IT285_04010 [Bdellovibrionales bacterium]|nr:hypothetical protein [Bdellovibrionales bacterium]